MNILFAGITILLFYVAPICVGVYLVYVLVNSNNLKKYTKFKIVKAVKRQTRGRGAGYQPNLKGFFVHTDGWAYRWLGPTFLSDTRIYGETEEKAYQALKEAKTISPKSVRSVEI